jgi:hypothetical protein
MRARIALGSDGERLDVGRDRDLSVGICEIADARPSVQATRVRSHPDGHVGDRLGLETEARVRSAEGGSERRDSQDRYRCWGGSFDTPDQCGGAGGKLGVSEFVGARRRSGDKRGDADAALVQMCEVVGEEAGGRIDPAIGDARQVESGIEPVASTAAEVSLNGNGAKARIDPDEQEPCPVPEQVGKGSAAMCIKL